MTNWPPKDWRALIALLGSIGGALALTLFVWWGCWELLPRVAGWSTATEAHRAETLRWVLWIATATISLVIMGLGFAINRRTLKGTLGKNGLELDYEGGEDVGGPAPKLEVPPVAFGDGKQ